MICLRAKDIALRHAVKSAVESVLENLSHENDGKVFHTTRRAQRSLAVALLGHFANVKLGMKIWMKIDGETEKPEDEDEDEDDEG